MYNFELEGILTLFYYPNLNEAFEFYKDKVGFEFVADFGYVKIFEVQEGALLGLVDGELGSHRPSPDKPVQIVVMVKDIDSWFRKIRKAGIETREQVPFTGKKMKLKGFHFQDPEGYTIEICQYLTKYGL
jgi:predicted enzyme related to lactoylglutathione lyase